MQEIPQNFTVFFTVGKISEICCVFLCKNICAMQKIPRFLHNYLQKNTQCKNATKNCEKNYEKNKRKNVNLLIQFIK